MMNNCINQQIKELILNREKFLLTTHVRPDGDGLGSLLSLGLGLLRAGKKVQMVLEDGVPSSFRHLPGTEMILRQDTAIPEIFILVDCSESTRAGKISEKYPIDINIDHHLTNTMFGRFNLVDPDAVATASIIAQNFTEWGLQMDQSIASALLTGIITDTLGFSTANTNPTTLRLSAKLMESGADLFDLYAHGLTFKSFEAVKYWGAGLSRLNRADTLVWTKLTLMDRKACGYPGNDDADLINILSSLEGFDIAILFVEQGDGKIKISWRAKPGFDISNLALQFGGGGHPAASGAELKGTMEEIEQTVVQDSLAYLRNMNETNQKADYSN
jgi:bifunctional oligoribonuclease and PAP phosphatase NrnA